MLSRTHMKTKVVPNEPISEHPFLEGLAILGDPFAEKLSPAARDTYEVGFATVYKRSALALHKRTKEWLRALPALARNRLRHA